MKGIRQYIPELYQVGDLWQQDKMTVLPTILNPMSDYYNRFKTISMYLRQAETGREAAALLDRLLNEISGNIREAAQAKSMFADWISEAKLYLKMM